MNIEQLSKAANDAEKSLQELTQLIAKAHEYNSRLYRADERVNGVWAWDDDFEANNLESLTCDILISPDQLRNVIAGAVKQYWLENYVNNNHCSLCGNKGVIDTRYRCTHAGLPVGRKNWCICPNGQSWKKTRNGVLPE